MKLIDRYRELAGPPPPPPPSTDTFSDLQHELYEAGQSLAHFTCDWNGPPESFDRSLNELAALKGRVDRATYEIWKRMSYEKENPLPGWREGRK